MSYPGFAQTLSRGAILGTLAVGLLSGCGPADSADRKNEPNIGGVLRADAGVSRGSPSGGDAGARGNPDSAPVSSSPPSPPSSVDGGATRAVDCQAVAAWKSGTAYGPDDRVRHGTPAHTYKCRPWPHGLWCAMAKYEPADEPGAWVDAWIDEGVCP